MSLENENYVNIWEECLSLLQKRIDDNQVFANFFYDTKIMSIKDNLVTIAVSNSFSAQVLNRKYIELIQQTLYDVTKTNFEVEVIDSTAIENNDEIKVQPKVFISNLNPKFTFENFVVGESNRESYYAAFTAATNPGEMCNPLFIYGKSGLGKTHLVHAVGNFIRSKNSNAKVLYKSVDDFVEDCVRAFKDADIESLKDLYRDVDVLLLDDVQFLSTKEKSKEVLFSIFNTLINANKQIILTSDRAPSDLKNLEDRLVGRFSCGLTVQIKQLEYDTAYKILKKKIENLDINDGNIDDEVLQYIAKNYSSDVRKLEGALNKILFYAVTFNKGTDINMDLVQSTFDVISKNKKDELTCDTIKTIVSDYYSISVTQLESKQRTANIAIARHIAMWLCRNLIKDVSLVQIGEAFGGKDHTTVINAIEKVDNLLKENSDYIIVINELKNLLKNH